MLALPSIWLEHWRPFWSRLRPSGVTEAHSALRSDIYFSTTVRREFSASVGRKSGSAFRHSPRNTPLRAGLSPQSGFGWRVLIHGRLARRSLRHVGDATARAAGRGSAGGAPRALPHRRLGRPSRPYALPVDLTGKRCRLPRSLARDQDGIRESFAHP